MAAEIRTKDNTVGTNIEHPNTFMYNGRWYSFTANVFSALDKTAKESLDNQHIDSFEYVNQINELCLRGSLTYRDIDGTISKFFNKNYNHIEVVCSQMKMAEVGDGTGVVGQLQQLVKAAKDTFASFVAFQHTFIIENIEITDRQYNQITYKLNLISENWYKAIAEIEYSNYDAPLATSPKENLKNPFVLIRTFLKNVGFEKNIDKESFDKAAELTKDVSIDYITNGNDDLFTVIPYLMNRLYYIDVFNKFKRFLYIIYDPIDQKYKVINYSDQQTWLGVMKPAVVFSMFETSFESSLFSENNQLGTTKKKKQTDIFKSLFVRKYWKYDREKGFFGGSGEDIDKEMLELMNNKSPDLKKVDGETKEKYTERLPEAFIGTNQYYNGQMQDTNNDYRIYNDLVDSFIARDALIVNCEGDITHRPGTAMGITLDRTSEKVPEDIPKSDLEELYKKHRQIEQIFMIFKTRHMYKLSSPAAYTENVVLARNFLLTPREVGKGTT